MIHLINFALLFYELKKHAVLLNGLDGLSAEAEASSPTGFGCSLDHLGLAARRGKQIFLGI